MKILASGAVAQRYLTKPVRVIVPFAPGGGSDLTARPKFKVVKDAGIKIN